jgi:hypothetical protein
MKLHHTKYEQNYFWFMANIIICLENDLNKELVS